MNSEVKEAIEILKGEYGMKVAADEVIVGMPDPKVGGCVLIGLKKAKLAALVYTSVHFDEDLRGEYEEVDWDQASQYLERWEAGLDGEALIFETEKGGN